MRRVLSAFVLVSVVAIPVLAQEPQTIATCEVSRQFADWVTKNPKADAALRERVSGIGTRLGQVCEREPIREFKDGSAALYLMTVDALVEQLDTAVADTLNRPLTVQGRKDLRFVAGASLRLQDWLTLRHFAAYQAVRVETKEVIRQLPPQVVQVAAQCPACPEQVQCPQLPQGPSEAELEQQRRRHRDEGERMQCNAVLKSGVLGWRETLGRLGSAGPEYDVSGAVYGLGNAVSACVSGGTVGCEDILGGMVPSWHAQLRSIIERDNRSAQKASQIIRSQLDSMEVDMAVRLRSCERDARR